MTVSLGLPTMPGRASADALLPPRPTNDVAPGLLDRFGRTATDLRVSLTDKCNLRCTYCMPAEGLPALPREQALDADEIVRLVGIGVRDLGIRQVPKEIVEAAGDGQIKDFVGTGPFRFVERIPDRHVRMARFDRYAARGEAPAGYGGRRTAYVDELHFIPAPDVSVPPGHGIHPHSGHGFERIGTVARLCRAQLRMTMQEDPCRERPATDDVPGRPSPSASSPSSSPAVRSRCRS